MRVPSTGVLLLIVVMLAAFALELGKATYRISEH